MAASMDIEKQFIRLIMFSHKISLPVVRTFFESCVLGRPEYNNDICSFLEYQKHVIFHLIGDYKCCQCSHLPPLQTTTFTFRLGIDQFKKLYEIGISQPGHFSRGSGGRVFQRCMCCVTVRKETNPKTYDLSLLITMLYNCFQLSDNIRLWLDTIRKCRNRLCHLNDISDLSENEIQTLWGNLESSVLKFAAEITSQPNYKEIIEITIDTFKYADYSRETITPIIEGMKSEINNNINGVIQNQIIAHEEIRSLTTHVEQLSEICKKDNHDMCKHVSESAQTIVDTYQDAVNQLSAQVGKCHIEEVELLNDQKKVFIESSQKVIETIEHAVEGIHFLVNIHHHKLQCRENNDTLPQFNPSEEEITTKEQKYSKESDKQRCKLHWRIETPGDMENKKDDIVKAMKNAIKIVKLGTSHDIEDIHEGSIVIDTLIPICILQDKNAFHHSIRKFLDSMVMVCDIDAKTPLDVKVQITLSDRYQDEVGQKMFMIKTMNIGVQAVPTMLDKSTITGEEETQTYTMSFNPDNFQRAGNNALVLRFDEPKYLSPRIVNEVDDSDENLLLVIGKIEETQWFHSAFSETDKGIVSNFELIHMPLTNLSKENIKSIICIVGKSSKEEDFLLVPELVDFDNIRNKVITVVLDKMTVPNLLNGTQQIVAARDCKTWLFDVREATDRSLSMVYALRFTGRHDYRLRLPSSYKETDDYQIALLMGNTKDVRSFYFDLCDALMDYTSMSLIHVSSRKVCKTTIKSVICIVDKSSSEEHFLRHQDIVNFENWKKDILTIVRNEVAIPDVLNGTTQINETSGNKGLSDFMDIINRKMSMVYILPFKKHQKSNRRGTYDEVNWLYLKGNYKDIQWFYLAMLKSSKCMLTQVRSCQLRSIAISSIIFIIATNSNEDVLQYSDADDLICWPEGAVTVVRDKIEVPSLLKSTKQIRVPGNEENWLSELFDILNKADSPETLRRWKKDSLSRFSERGSGHARRAKTDYLSKYIPRSLSSTYDNEDVDSESDYDGEI